MYYFSPADIPSGIVLRTKAHLDVDRLIAFLKDIKYFFCWLVNNFYFYCVLLHIKNLLYE